MAQATQPEARSGEASPANDDKASRGRAIVFAVVLGLSVLGAVARDVYAPYVGGLGFHTPLFVAFFAWFFVVYHFVASNDNERLWLITIGSLLFYGSFGLHFVPLVLATGLADFYLAKRIAAAPERRTKRLLVSASIGMNVLVLCLFKYAGFFLANMFTVARALGVSEAQPVLALAMPVGISFYTFQAISYTVDVYHGKIAPCRRPLEFLAALTFFPHLAAGPIVRSSYLLPQFEAQSPPRWDEVKRACLLIAAGLANKELADLLGRAADPVFASATPQGALVTWTGALAFGGQVFGDFCGYTDMATGLALLLGFSLPPNFNLPYLATSPIDFWRRWHISLSTWLRDYLWIPLARTFPRARYSVLLVVMFVAGLWHGATWTFAVWGLYHGVLLISNHMLKARFPNPKPSKLASFAGWLVTFYFVALGFVMFRASSFRAVYRFLREMHAPIAPTELSRPALALFGLVVLGLVLGHALAALAKDRRAVVRKGLFFWPAVTLLLALSFSVSRMGTGFIYFQF
jgi:alginate O-acetyltransferase complex protein AlgI